MSQSSIDPADRPPLRTRRSATTPLTPTGLERRPSSSWKANPAPSVKTLYVHPSVKIVAFTAGRVSSGQYGHETPAPEKEPGSLPCGSQLERTMAIGAFQIYRAPESVAFVRCGSALRPILPKSQCWGVNESSSHFVLQIRRPNYWRIELPSESEEDAELIAKLRRVWAEILQFEKTPCPFARSFTVDLPEVPATPVRRRPWTASVRPSSMGWSPVPLATAPSPAQMSSPAHKPRRPARRFSDFDLTSHTLPTLSASLIDDRSETTWTPSVTELDEDTSSSTLFEEDLDEEFGTKHEDGEAFENARSSSEDTNGSYMPLAKEPPPNPNPKTLRRSARGVSPSPSIIDAAADMSSAGPYDQPRERIEAAVAVAHDSIQPDTGTHSSSAAAAPSHDEDASAAMLESPISPQSEEAAALEGSGQMQSKRERITAFTSRRARAAASLGRRASHKPPTPLLVECGERDDHTEPVTEAISPTESLDSFQSTESWHTPITPMLLTPPASQEGSPTKTWPTPLGHGVYSARNGHTRDHSELTITPILQSHPEDREDDADRVSTPAEDMEDALDTLEAMAQSLAHADETSPEDSTQSEPQSSILHKVDSVASTSSFVSAHSAATSSTDYQRTSRLRHRPTTSLSISTHRPLSPLPSAANLFSPTTFHHVRNNHHLTQRPRSATKLQIAKRLPGAIISKTVEILMSPPSHLVNLMLKVAASIAAGEWRGAIFGIDDEGEPVDVRWDWSEADSTGDALEGWAESDFDFETIRANRARRRSDALHGCEGGSGTGLGTGDSAGKVTGETRGVAASGEERRPSLGVD